MGLKRDVIISIYYMSNDLTFEILHMIFQNFPGYKDSEVFFFVVCFVKLSDPAALKLNNNKKK